MAQYDDQHREVPDSTPLAIPLHLRGGDNLASMIAERLRAARLLAEAEGLESPEEADDFEVDEDPMPQSRWEVPADTRYRDFLSASRQRGSGGSGAVPPPETTAGDKPAEKPREGQK